MKGDLRMKRVRAMAVAMAVVAGGAALGLGGCASPGSPGASMAAEPLPPSTTTTAEQLKPSTFGVAGPKAGQYAYPSFGAPAQIGDRPVMNPTDTAKMQSDLEALAKQREQQLLQSSKEEGRDGQ